MKKIKEKIRKHIEKRGKGFTLVELLAVIVILAVVILIAVTAVIPRMNSARKNAFADEALAYIKAAKEANVESQMDGSSGGTCFSIEYLNQNYIDKKSDAYEGYISYDSEDDIWKAFIKNDKYMINGEGGNLSKSNVVDVGELSLAPSGCIGVPLPPICKRATTLHTETCNQTSTSSYCSGAGYAKGSTVTYGNLGTGSLLATGDALDCDVNGDGTYDAATERFYFVTDVNDTALLIYYNNVTDGFPDRKTKHAYNTDVSDYLGPQTALLQLPISTQWNNVSLIRTKRDIEDEKGNVKVSNFSYDGYAARIITYQEITSACYDGTTSIISRDGLTSKCEYLFENTDYTVSSTNQGHWLETEDSSRVVDAWFVYSADRRLGSSSASSIYGSGVRPTIEVSKSRIEL